MPAESRSPPRLMIVLPNLGAGGAERSLMALANRLKPTFEVIIATVSATDSESPPFGLERTPLYLWGIWGFWIRLPWLVWRYRPSVVLSTIFDLNLLVLLLKPSFPRSTRVVVREAVSLRHVDLSSWPGFWHWLYRWLYPRASSIIVLTEEMKQVLRKRVKLNEDSVAVIPNAVSPDRCSRVHTLSRFSRTGEIRLVSIGRLVPQKGYDVLIESLAAVALHYPRVRLHIYGEGPDRTRLERLIDLHGLGDHVFLHGQVEDISSAFRKADLYILSSRYEGMSNAMLEALCHGVPVVAVAEHTGAAEVIIDNETGFLVPRCSVTDLATGVMRGAERYRKLNRGRIRRFALKQFSLRRVVSQYRDQLTGGFVESPRPADERQKAAPKR